jgi:hypothetical protein
MTGWTFGDIDGLEITTGEFVVATTKTAEVSEYAPLSALLRRVQHALGIELAFVSGWADGAPLVCARGHRGEPDALQAAYGLRLLEAGTRTGHYAFASVPVVCRRGIAHGTLCARYAPGAGSIDPQQGALARVARLIAAWFEDARGGFPEGA